MGLFDSIQDLISGAADSALGSVGDAVGGITDIPLLQDVQEQAQTAIDDITQNLKL